MSKYDFNTMRRSVVALGKPYSLRFSLKGTNNASSFTENSVRILGGLDDFLDRKSFNWILRGMSY